jgi:hypothetical protein
MSTICPFAASGYAEQSWFFNLLVFDLGELGVTLKVD